MSNAVAQQQKGDLALIRRVLRSSFLTNAEAERKEGTPIPQADVPRVDVEWPLAADASSRAGFVPGSLAAVTEAACRGLDRNTARFSLLSTGHQDTAI